MFKEWLLNRNINKYKDYEFDIILVAGQSNAEGCGRGNNELCYGVNDNLYLMRTFGKIALLVDSPKKSSSFCVQFARKYLENDMLEQGRKLLVMNMAIGGTGFSDKRWGKNDDLYLNMIKKLQLILGLNSKNRVKAFLWHQGETDVYNNLSPIEYTDNLTYLLNSVRSQFSLENIPFIVGDFVEEWRKVTPNNVIIADCLRDIASLNNNCGFVETNDIECNSNNDIIHFSRKGCIELGNRYYSEYTRITTARN